MVVPCHYVYYMLSLVLCDKFWGAKYIHGRWCWADGVFSSLKTPFIHQGAIITFWIWRVDLRSTGGQVEKIIPQGNPQCCACWHTRGPNWVVTLFQFDKFFGYIGCVLVCWTRLDRVCFDRFPTVYTIGWQWDSIINSSRPFMFMGMERPFNQLTGHKRKKIIAEQVWEKWTPCQVFSALRDSFYFLHKFIYIQKFQYMCLIE